MTKVPPDLGHPPSACNGTSAAPDRGRTRAKTQLPGILGGRRFISVSTTTTDPSGSSPEGLSERLRRLTSRCDQTLDGTCLASHIGLTRLRSGGQSTRRTRPIRCHEPPPL